jgi:hypothetical protein
MLDTHTLFYGDDLGSTQIMSCPVLNDFVSFETFTIF